MNTPTVPAHKTLFGLSLLAVASLAVAEPQIEEIIVHADFRDAGELRYPASLTVVGADTIAGRAARHLDEILNVAPNVNFAAGASRGRYIQIRGIGERSQFVDPVDASVGLTVDNINLSGVGNAATLFDVEQVEVLRGPQGTRFGASALAGMINIASVAPTDRFEGRVSAGVGNADTRELGLVVNAPLTDGLNSRLAVQQYRSDGFIDNTYLDRDDTGERDELTARGRLRWQPSDDFTLDTTLLYVDVDNGYDHFSLDNNRRTLSDEPGRDAQETTALGLTGTWSGSDRFVLQTTVAFENTNLEYGFDEDWTNTAICEGLACDSDLWGFDWWYSSTDSYLRDRQAMQFDIRLVSTEQSRLFDRVDWVLGFYGQDRQEDLTRHFFDWDAYQQAVFTSDYETRNLAVYGELSAPLSDRLTLTLGGRMEDFSGDYADSRQIQAEPGDDLWGGEISLQYQAGDTTMVYGLVSRGYKAGGVNGEALGKARANAYSDSILAFLDQRLEFATETALNYEIGVKGRYWDDRLSLRASAFYMERDDVQLKGWYNEGVTFVGYIDNGSTGTNQGVEVEFNARLLPTLALFANVAWLETEIQDFYVNVDDSLVDQSGRDQAHAPHYQFNIGGEWQVLDNLAARVEVEGRDSFYFSDSHDRRSGNYNLVHASLAWTLANLELRLWGRNLTDKDYAVRGFYFANDPRVFYEDDTAYVQLGDPRSYGLTASYRF